VVTFYQRADNALLKTFFIEKSIIRADHRFATLSELASGAIEYILPKTRRVVDSSITSFKAQLFNFVADEDGVKLKQRNLNWYSKLGITAYYKDKHIECVSTTYHSYNNPSYSFMPIVNIVAGNGKSHSSIMTFIYG
jgi:hypothetical protein